MKYFTCDNNTVMKTQALCLILITVLSLTARGDLTIAEKIDGAGPAQEITKKIKGDKVRIETPRMTTMIDSKTGDMLALMNDQKKFRRMSGDQAKAFAEMASKHSPNSGAIAEKAKLVPTGKKETINGYETEEYVSETPSFKASYWIALNYPDSAAIMKQLQAVRPAASRDVATGMSNYRDFPGLPLRTQMTIGGKEITVTITSVKQNTLSEAEFAFAVPKDFEEMKVPNMPNMLGGKSSITPSAKP